MGIATQEGRVEIGTVSIVAATAKNNTFCDVSTKNALIRALTEAEEIVLTQAPTGRHMMGVIAQLKLDTTVAKKIRRFDKSQEVNGYLVSSSRKKSRALAFGPATEVIAGKDNGVTCVGLIPEEFQTRLPYSAACLSSSAEDAAARAFLAELARESSRDILAATGVEQTQVY